MICYIDTCILVSYYLPEVSSEKVEEFLLALEVPIISALTEIEFLSVLSKKLRRKELNQQTTRDVLERYKSHLEQDYYKKINIKADHYQQAKNWLSNFKVSMGSLDAMHLSVAVMENVPLITADKKLANAASAINAKVKLL